MWSLTLTFVLCDLQPYYLLPHCVFILGSVTLRQWQQLATPHLGGIFEARPGVQNKGERKLDLQEEEVYHLSDFEEDGTNM